MKHEKTSVPGGEVLNNKKIKNFKKNQSKNMQVKKKEVPRCEGESDFEYYFRIMFLTK